MENYLIAVLSYLQLEDWHQFSYSGIKKSKEVCCSRKLEFFKEGLRGLCQFHFEYETVEPTLLKSFKGNKSNLAHRKFRTSKDFTMEASMQRVYQEQQQHIKRSVLQPTSITYNLPPFPNIIKEFFFLIPPTMCFTQLMCVFDMLDKE